MDYELIIANLAAAGKTTESWESSDGSRVLILPHGGRVLGLFTPAGPANLLWTNPGLDSIGSALRLFESDEWQNPGGDRTWLAPEVDFNLPDYPKCERYCVPADLDPGHYTVVTDNGRVTFENSATLKLSRHKRPVRLTISKSIGPALNPLRNEAEGLSEIEYAGYSLRARLELDDTNGTRASVGLWNLLQMPHGGEMIIPTYARAEPKIYLGNVAREDLIVTDKLVRYKMRAPGEQKIGIGATVTTGRAGYIYRVGEQTALVIRNFNVNPSGEYVDVHWQEPEKPGVVFQACNVNNALGSFSELEYHAPAIGPQLGKTVCEDESQVWGFRGPELEITAVARRLLTHYI
jgi:hypothetical protein